MIIRREDKRDRDEVDVLIEEAFRDMPDSDHSEHLWVQRLRDSEVFIDDLSLVAELENRIVGHVLFTKIYVEEGSNSIEGLSLAPVSVLPAFQNKGIGSALIKAGLKIGRELNYPFCVLLGHEEYYPRFGFVKSEDYDISFPFDAPAENCMVLPFSDRGLEGVSGQVRYPVP